MRLARVLLGLAICLTATRTAIAQNDVRALLILSSSTDSPEAARRAVVSALESGFGAVVVPVSPHTGAPPALADVIEQARQRGLRVYASLNVNLATPVGELPASRDHVIYQHPEWLMVPRELAAELMKLDARKPDYVGKLLRWTRANSTRAGGLYISPLHEAATAYLTQAVRDVVQKYEIDGVQLEGLEYPGGDFDYSRLAIEQFRSDVRAGLSGAERDRMNQVEAIDPFAYANEYPDQWTAFRQSRLTTLAARLGAAVRSARATTVVSAAIAGDPVVALRDRFQDWQTWMNSGFVDAVSRRDGPARNILFDYDRLLKALPGLTTTPASGSPGPQ